MPKYKHTFNLFPECKRQSKRGIPTGKKDNILKLSRGEKDRSKVLFWNQIEVYDESVDLMCENELRVDESAKKKGAKRKLNNTA